ncbi:MAG TPA: outer membrane lipoprotein chaperone LolA [Longimicrobiales bacterium]|nr:outer membrane lipoprotein chaperone LolA [Longimicrobiales bacterium]
MSFAFVPARRVFLLALSLCVLGACSDATDDGAGETDAIESLSPAGATGEYPAAAGEPGDSTGAPGPGGGAIAPGVTPEAGPGAAPGGATNPTAPPPSSARDGSGPPGGDDLGSGRDVGAAVTPADAILARAADAYADVRTLRADFEQTTENPVLRRTTTSRGTIFQARPDRFLMRFSQPAGDRIVSDGTYIWVYYPSVDERQVIRMRAGAGGAGAVDLQAQFLGDPTRRFDATLLGEASVGGRPADVLVLTPREPGNFRSLKVWVDRRDHLVRRFEITEHNGVIRRFLLRNLTPGADVADSLFRFTPPEGAHVVARG